MRALVIPRQPVAITGGLKAWPTENPGTRELASHEGLLTFIREQRPCSAELEFLGESIQVYNDGGWNVGDVEAQRAVFRVVAKATGWACPPDMSYEHNAPWFFAERDSDRALTLMERVIRGECENRKGSGSMGPLLRAAGW